MIFQRIRSTGHRNPESVPGRQRRPDPEDSNQGAALFWEADLYRFGSGGRQQAVHCSNRLSGSAEFYLDGQDATIQFYENS